MGSKRFEGVQRRGAGGLKREFRADLGDFWGFREGFHGVQTFLGLQGVRQGQRGLRGFLDWGILDFPSFTQTVQFWIFAVLNWNSGFSQF